MASTNRGIGGRPHGSINKRSLAFRERLDALCKKHNWDPIESMVSIARTAEAKDDLPIAISATKVLLDYGYPRLKAVESTSVEPLQVVLTDATQAANLLPKKDDE